MAFCPRMCSGSECAHVARISVRFESCFRDAYLEKFKQHVVEVGRHIDDV